MSYSEKVLALAQFLNVSPATITEPADDEAGYFESSEANGEYLVLTDEEADRAADERLESYIDDCILPEVPAEFSYYFNREALSRDALLSDGRGHTIASYDSNEEEEKVNGTWYYIYRTN